MSFSLSLNITLLAYGLCENVKQSIPEAAGPAEDGEVSLFPSLLLAHGHTIYLGSSFPGPPLLVWLNMAPPANLKPQGLETSILASVSVGLTILGVL